jgi:antitoxin component YwqK of YwqJK toxin-antitoxin module
MKNILILILFFSFNQAISQEKVELKDLYYENYVAHKISDGKLFTGIAQKTRNNGHIIYDEVYENGILIKSTVYYNRTENPIPARVILYYEKSFTPKTEINYGLSKPRIEYIHYNQNGKKILNEIFTDDKLTYKCEYENGKKHGTEYCVNDDGTELTIEYNNGKKIK